MKRLLCWITSLAVCTAAVGGCDRPGEVSEALDQGAMAFGTEGMEVTLSALVPKDALDPSLGWLRTPNSGTGSQQMGNMLAAFTWYDPLSTGNTHYQAGWAYSQLNWVNNLTAPSFTTKNPNAWLGTGVGFEWPHPENLCQVPEYYNSEGALCGGSGFDWNTSTLRHWQRPAAALWTGLNDGAAIVTTARGQNSGNEENVFIVASDDGGQTFRNSYVLGIPAEDGTPTAGPWSLTEKHGVVPGSVHASLAYFGERTSSLAGRVSLPIYVTWQTTDSSAYNPTWWWTRVIVGDRGEIALTMLPKELPSWVPTGAGVHVAIFGYRIDGEERVSIAWSDRADKASPNTCDGSVGTLVETSWWASTTKDLGEGWGCFTGSEAVGESSYYDCALENGSYRRTLLAYDEEWLACSSTPGSGGNEVPRNDRPEVAVHAPSHNDETVLVENDAEKFFYFAINNGERVRVYRTGGIPFVNDDYDRILTLAVAGASGDEGHAQAISVAQAHNDGPRVEVSFRAQSGSNMVQKVTEIRHVADPYLSSPTNHTISGTFPIAEGNWGLYSGIAGIELCDADNGDCPLSPTDSGGDDVEFFTLWSSTANTLVTHAEVYGQGFEYNP